jgi:hypothetical protein
MNIKQITTGNLKTDEALRSLYSLLAMQQDEINKLKSTVNQCRIDIGNKLTESKKIKITSEGGLAILLQNKTGAPSVKGYVVSIYSATAINSSVKLIAQNVPDPVGVFYDSGVVDGNDAWVVISGIVDVYFIGNTTRGFLARGFVTSDAGFVAGQALAEAVPTSPFATDKHFYEIGHVIESRVGAGLAKIVMHFN